MAGITSDAFAQEKTRAEVRQELIQAENNGLHFVTDTSYPGINPIFEQQAARLKQQSESGVGADMTGSSATGTTTFTTSIRRGCVIHIGRLVASRRFREIGSVRKSLSVHHMYRSTNVKSDVHNAPPASELDDDTFEFANAVFDLARAGDSETLGALLGKGLPPNLRNHRGDSLLMLAAYHGHLETVRVLLRHRSDPDLRNSNGQTPLAGAAFKGDLPMIKLLLAYRADIEGASPDGRTALMIAAMFDRTRIVEYLVSRGANLDATDASGVSAADVAQRMGASKALALLQELKSASLSAR